MKQLSFITTLIAFLLIGCGAPTNSVETNGLTLSQQVYETVILELAKDAITPVIVGDQTELIFGDSNTADSFIDNNPEFDDSINLFASLIQSNQTPRDINWTPTLVAAHISPLSDWPTSQEDYRLARTKNAKYIIKLSSVAINPETYDALIGIAIDCGALCGAGSIIHLRKTGPSWKIVKSAPLWMS